MISIPEPSITQIMAVITKVDNKNTLDRLNSDPSLVIISGCLKTTNLILKQKGYGTQVGVALESWVGLRMS